jgi:predicted DNA-binding mobile mystery protein A
MQKEERALAREKLDKEQRFFRVAGKHHSYFPNWLRRVRQALGVPVAEMAHEMGVHRSVIFRMEKSEDRQTIRLKALEQMAEAMDCKVIYAIVPRQGKTLTELAEWRRWSKALKEG